MGFLIIQGTYHIVGYEPDGDSIRFKPKNSKDLAKLEGPKAKANKKGHVQLRLEAIDTLETHYSVGNGLPQAHQPKQLAQAGLVALLANLGFANVVWGPSGKRVTDANDGTPGYILSRTVEKFGRPVAFAFTGKPPKPSGSDFYLDATHLKKSVNYKSVASGVAYPTYYQGLFYDLRNAFTAATAKAREGKLGVWAKDKTEAGFTAASLKAITDTHVIMPKLFRRLSKHLAAGKKPDSFVAALAKSPEDVFILSQGHFTHFDNVIEYKKASKKLRMIFPPEDLVFRG